MTQINRLVLEFAVSESDGPAIEARAMEVAERFYGPDHLGTIRLEFSALHPKIMYCREVLQWECGVVARLVPDGPKSR